MLIEFLKAIKEGTQVYFIIDGMVISGDLMKVDYDKEYVQIKTAKFESGLTVPFFVLPFVHLRAWGVRPK